LFRFLMN